MTHRIHENIEVTNVVCLPNEDYHLLYKSNYGKTGTLQLDLHDSWHGYKVSTLLLFKSENRILGYALVTQRVKGLEAAYWVMRGERRRGIGTKLKEAAHRLFRFKHVDWNFDYINSEKL